MEFIKVSDEKSSVKLPTKKNKISLQTIRSYFPGASSLMYFDKEEKFGLQLCNDEVELMPGVFEYHIHYTDNLKENNPSGARKKRIEELIDDVEGNVNRNFKSRNLPRNPVRKMPKRLVEVVWREKKYSHKGFYYEQMKGTYGGVKKMELDPQKDYSYEAIKNLAVQAMRSSKNEHTLNNSIIQLATNDEEIVESFTDERGRECSFWEFAPKFKKVNAQLRVCLLSTPRKSTTEKSNNRQSKVGSSLEKSKSGLQKPIFTLTSRKFSDHHNISCVSVNNTANGPNKKISNEYTGVEMIVDNSHDKLFDSSKRQPAYNSTQHTEENILSIELSVPVIDENEIEFSDKILGQGAFGSVILCKWRRNGSSVAVKKIRAPENKKYLVREMKVLDAIRHPNIVSLMAACCGEPFWYIVMEYFRSQSLRQFINNRPQDVEFLQKRKENYEICLQISQAVSYLHEQVSSILHKDIKPDNILINDHLIVKLCDLGLSKTSDMDSTSALNTTVGHNFRGTPMFMAPEIIVQNLPASRSTDVWAMACCFVQLFCEREVWVIEPKFTTSGLRELLLKGLKPDLTNIPTVLQETISNCFNHDPTERLTALMLVKKFDRLLSSILKKF